jgi:hypothetical protein
MSAPAGTFRYGAALWISFAVCAAAAFWTSEGVAPWDGDQHNAWHHYEYLAEGFAHGHTYLSVDPDPGLLALRDPYDPAANAKFRLWDASYYKGRYYLYFGPAPALFMAAGRVLTGRMLPQRLAVAGFAVAGFAGLVLLLRDVRRRHFPGLPAWGLAAIILVAFDASWFPVALRRSAVWELPIVAAAACLWWAIYFLWRFQESGGRARWAVAAGFAAALLMASRVTCLPAAAAITLLLLVPVAGRGPAPSRRWGPALAAAGVAFAGCLALLAYNHARFGSWLEFGDTYQLRGFDERNIAHFSLANAVFNARAYFLSLPQFGPYFPFLHPFWTDDTPPGYIAFEDFYPVLFSMPVHLVGLAACSWAWRGRAGGGGRPVCVVIAAAVCASVLAALVLSSFGGTCSRYVVELVAGSTVAASIGLMAIFGSEEGARLGRLVRPFAAAAACWTMACVWIASAEFRGFMKETNPRTYRAVAHALDYPSYWWARAHGVAYGPVDLVARVPSSPSDRETILVASGRPQFVNHLILEQYASAGARLVLTVNQHHVLDTPEFSMPSVRLHVRLDAPWLYPPAESPYWDAVTDPAVRERRQTLFSLEWDTGSAAITSDHYGDPIKFEPVFRVASQAAPGSPFIESFAPAAPTP